MTNEELAKELEKSEQKALEIKRALTLLEVEAIQHAQKLSELIAKVEKRVSKNEN